MLLKKIKLENIRSYKNAEIEFPEGSTLISGDIGSGKTSVLLAIEFALFGLQPGQRGSSLLRNGEKAGRVVLEFQVDGKQIIIERALKRGRTISQGKVSIEIEGKRQDTSILELKNHVLSILNYPTEFRKKTNMLYRFTVYTPQEEMKQIILENRETRLNTLRHVFDIDKYKKIKENTSIVTSKLREIKRNKEGMVSDLANKQKSLNEKKQILQDIISKVSEKERELEETTKKRQEIEKKKIELEEKINEKNKLSGEVDKAKVMILGKKEMIYSIDTDIKTLNIDINEISKIKFDTNEINKTVERIEKNKEQEKHWNEKYTDVAGKINFFKSKIEESSKLNSQISTLTTCPTCLQSVDDTYRYNILNKLENEIKGSQRRILEIEEQKKEAEKELEQVRKELTEDNKKLTELQTLKLKIQNLEEKKNRVKKIQEDKKKSEKDIKLLEQHITSLKDNILKLSKFENIFKLKEKEVEQATRDEKQIEIKLAELNKEIEITREQISELDKEIENKIKIKNELQYLSEIENWLSANFLDLISFTEQNVMLKLREEFSQLFNEWFSTLVSAALSARVDEDFTPIIEQQDYEIDYAYLSGGERTATALAYRLALNQTINSLLSKLKTKDIVILDEPTDGFSQQQLDKMRDVLQQLNVKQLILVSHEPKMESFVENIIRFKKLDNVTEVS